LLLLQAPEMRLSLSEEFATRIFDGHFGNI
jgi:hypothetical protein